MAEDLDGIWTFAGPTYVLDNNLACRTNHTVKEGEAAPHGTFTGIPYYRLYMLGSDEFLLFDENGDFARFALETATGRWLWKPDPWVVTVPPGDDFAPKGATLTRYPTLALTRYNTTDNIRPSGSTANWCPRPQRKNNARPPTIPEQELLQWVVLSKSPKPNNRTEFYWKPSEGEEGLLFSRAPGPDRQKADANDKKFGDVFVVQSEHSQLTFPFCGFDIRNLNLFAQLGPGTQWRYDPANDREGIGGRLLFKYPTTDSKDYWQQEDAKGQPFLPLGLRLVDVPFSTGITHSEMVSSVADHLSSYSAAFGLDGGIDKLLGTKINVACNSQMQDHQKSESRYTISRTIQAESAYVADIPSMELQDDFVDDIQRRLVEKLSGKTVSWENFINRYGMHYAAAIIQGWMEIAETRFSLKAESQARDLDLKAAATGIFGKVFPGGKDKGAAKGKGALDLSAAWKTAHSVEIDSSDVNHFTIGSDSKPIGILFDLRPLNRLLNPIFFAYNPAHPWRKMAPFVWYDLRDGLSSYLDKLGFNKALEPSLLTEFTPRRVKVSFADIRVEIDDRRALGDKNLKLFAYGTIDFRDCDAVTPDDAAAPNDKDPPRFTLAKIGYAPEGELITGGGQSPDYAKFGTTLAVKRGQKARVELDVRLQLRPYNYAGIDEKSNLAAYGSIRPATWKFEPPKYETLPYIEAANIAGHAVSYRLYITVHWEDVSW